MIKHKETKLTLEDFGWSQVFELSPADPVFDNIMPVRVMAVHRDAYDVANHEFSGRIKGNLPARNEEARLTVGDWVAMDRATCRILALYPRKSLFKRRNAGKTNRLQLIAANVDTVFIVTSANNDFNIARLERYLALAHEAQVFPVLVITKADLVDDMAPFLADARALRNDLVVAPVNAKSGAGLEALLPWLGHGQTVALMGSSGVGKSTIINAFLEQEAQATAGIREDDSRGRHTTSGRSLHRMKTGAWLMDTPGMREIQIVETASGIDSVFDDITALAADCRFSNCAHMGEPGCAVEAATKAGTLDVERLTRFRKLQLEERNNTQSMYEAHERSRTFGKMVKSAMKEKARRKEDW